MSARKMLLLIDSPTQLDDRVEAILRLLGELGIGGLRSRGLGRFTVERVRLTAEDEQALGMVVPFSKAGHGYLLSLGELPLSNALDWKHSFFETHMIAGYVGPPYAQALYGPLVVTRVGAIVKKGYSEPSPVKPVKFGESVSMFINPLVIVG
jgi:CRISPR-associated protein Csm4